MKALRTAAFVVGAAALVATGVGAAVSAGLIGSVAAGATTATFLGVTAATFTAVGAIAGAVGAGLSLLAAAAAPKGSIGGSATQFKIDKDAGNPVIIGRTYSGGNVVHRQYYGSKNSLESWVTVHSIGPVRSLGSLLINKVAVALAGTAITGSYAGYMWLDQQLGACPEARALAGPQGAFPGWSGSSKLSGLAADLWTLKFDEKGKIYPNGVPQRGRIVEGVYVYDPRQDSTYPGGTGSCRLGQEATYVWSDNPALHAITWAFGRYQNGVLIAGGGMEAEGIDMPPFVDWANVCDANGWKVGGIVYTTSDNSWDILKMIAQAGGGEVFPVGAQLSCSFNAPRVSIGTITSDDICGDVDVPGTASRRLRRNTVIPRVRLESHGWEEVPLDAIPIPAYVSVDGGSRPVEISFPLVQQVDQGAQLGLYAMFNGRELDGIVLPSKVYAIGYRPGDCLTVDIPEAALNARDVVVRQREIEGSTMAVTLTCRSETHAKHAFCLGKTGKAPPTPDLSVPPSYPVENASLLQLAVATSFPVGLTITAAADGSIAISDHVRRYTDGHADVVVAGATIATGLAPGSFRAIGYDDPDRLGLPAASSPTNLLASPRDLGSGAWGRNGMTLTGEQPSLDGLARAWLAVPAASGVKYMFSQGNGGAGPKTVSILAKAAGYHHVIVKGVSANGGSRFGAVVDLSNGAVVGTPSTGAPTGTGVTVTPMGDGWYQIAVTQDTTTGFGEVGVLPLPSATATLNGDLDLTDACDGTSGVLLDFARIDQSGVAGRPSAYRLFADDIDARASPAHPGRHYVGYAIVPTSGSPPSSGGGATPPGGRCPTVDTPILMADMSHKAAGNVAAGDWVWTRHETTLGWGFYQVEAVEIAESDDVWRAEIDGQVLRATGDHRVYTGRWVTIRDLPGAQRLPGTQQIVKITVTEAHTYVSNGILSHNIKSEQSLDPEA